MNYPVQVWKGVTLGVLEPVVGVACHDYVLARDVAIDGEWACADDFRGVRFDVPSRGEGAIVHVGLQDVPGIDGRAH